MIEQHRRGFLVMACYLLGCASSPSSIPEMARTGQQDEGVEVSLELETLRKDGLGSRAVLPGDTLMDGDNLAMKIRVDRPAHVYMLLLPPSGVSLMLYPEKGDEEAQPGKVLRVPDEGSWFEVRGEQGMENVVVVASTRALAQNAILDAQQHPTDLLSGSAAAQSGGVKKGKSKTKDERPPCPKKASCEDGRGNCERLWSRAGRQGIAVIRFAFQHH